MAAVSNRTTYSEPRKAIFLILDNRSNIQDPRSGNSRSTRKFVFDVDPLMRDVDLTDFPHIYVEEPLLLKSKQSANYQTKEYVWRQRILARTLKNGSGQNKEDYGVNDIRSMSDSLSETFDSASAREVMKEHGLSLMEFQQTQPATPFLFDNQTVYEAIFELTYRVRMRAQ